MKRTVLTLMTIVGLWSMAHCGGETQDWEQAPLNSHTQAMIEFDSPMAPIEPVIDEPVYKTSQEKCEERGGLWLGDCLEIDPDTGRCVTESKMKGDCAIDMGYDE